MAFSSCGIAILPCLSYWFGTSLERRYMARQHIIRVDLICVVFLGGCIGTALRYACSVIPDCGAFHIGTFAANMAACFVYAALSAWLGGTRRTVGRAKEYVNRGCGMGMCGGLSTMLAYVGAHVGLRFAGTEHNDGDRHAMGKEAD